MDWPIMIRLRFNKALPPTAYSSVRCVRSSLRSLRFLRRVSLSLGGTTALGALHENLGLHCC